MLFILYFVILSNVIQYNNKDYIIGDNIMMKKDQEYVSYSINSSTALNMVTQIRVKQLATESAQNLLNKEIIKKFEESKDISGEYLVKQIKANLSEWLEYIKEVNAKFATKEALENVGYPIKFNKTALQLKMALDWVNNSEDKDIDLFQNLKNSIFYNNLNNNVESDKLPLLKSSSDSVFWGNENPSVSTVLLYSIASTIDAETKIGTQTKLDKLVGAATFYPFFKEGYKIDASNNPFVFEDGFLLFGDYQFGGHRYFSNEHPNLGQRIIYPEDCSSAVGKATNLTEKQIVGINTRAIADAYKNKDNEYKYNAITSSEQGLLDYEKIELGDIYLRNGHTNIVYSKDNYGNLDSLEFNRDLEAETGQRTLGGGINKYKLFDINKNIVDKNEPHMYILRSGISGLMEECSLPYLLTKIDTQYNKFYEEGHDLSVIGDCDTFLGYV
jgi:hypothetical protein